jgi:hypothetical protein
MGAGKQPSFWPREALGLTWKLALELEGSMWSRVFSTKMGP